MTPSQKARYGCEAARNTKWRLAAPPVSLVKRPAGVPQPWPLHPHPAGHRSHFPPQPPNLPLFHTRHAEESAERPHLVTIVRPCGHSSLRKVTVLLNRRGVVSFEQLLLDVSEALGFPRWHRARVTRLYTTHAREVKGVCDFFRGEVAFLALGKARPELSSLQEALEELYPEHSHYRADALRAWERRLRPPPDKAAKADSGYSEGTDSSGTNQETHRDTKTNVKNHINTHTSQHADKRKADLYNFGSQKSDKKNSNRKIALPPNHLQRLRVRGGMREREHSVIGPFKHENVFREEDMPSPTLCENCLVRRLKHQGADLITTLSGKAPLPPVSRKQKGSSHIEQEVKINPSPPSPPISRGEERSLEQSQHFNPAPDVGEVHADPQKEKAFNLPSDGSDITLSDIERSYDIGRVVGDGNFAVVRECRRLNDGQILAMKIVERSKLIGREHMMQNELSLLGSLCHARIVRLFAHHHTLTHSYLVMELVSGGDLFEAISERGKFSEEASGLMVSDVSEALNYIHCKSIVHRDLKPENLLIEEGAAGVCRLKLGDFGLAMVVTEPVFTICGTPTYVAPEILCETGYGVPVDVWALGVILYILLCGFPPFRSRDRDQEELFQIIKQGQFHFPSPYWDSISEEAKGLVRALLQPDPTVRLTADQILLHPWVKAMASICRQRALTDRCESNSEATEAQTERLYRPTQTESVVNITSGHGGSKGKSAPKELCRHEGRQTEVNREIQAKDSNTVQSLSPQLEEPESCKHKEEFISADTQKAQDPGPKLLITNSRELEKLVSPIPKADLSSQNKTQSKPNSQLQSPVDSQFPPNRAVHSTQHNTTVISPTASSSQCPDQKNVTTTTQEPTAAIPNNHSNEKHNKSNSHITVTHPPTQA